MTRRTYHVSCDTPCVVIPSLTPAADIKAGLSIGRAGLIQQECKVLLSLLAAANNKAELPQCTVSAHERMVAVLLDTLYICW